MATTDDLPVDGCVCTSCGRKWPLNPAMNYSGLSTRFLRYERGEGPSWSQRLYECKCSVCLAKTVAKGQTTLGEA